MLSDSTLALIINRSWLLREVKVVDRVFEINVVKFVGYST